MIFAFEDFELDALRLDLRRAGTVVQADTLILRFLAVLVRNAGRLVSKEELVQEVWDGRAVADNAITVTVARLRKTLGHKRGDKELVTTVYGRGYRFVGIVHERSAVPPSEARTPQGAVVPLMVGRERVLEALQRTHREVRMGRGRLCVLLGEPGIGKTHVVEAFTRALPHDARASWGFCRETGDTPPLFPWSQVLQELISASPHGQGAREGEGPALPLVLRGPEVASEPTAITEDVWLEGFKRGVAFESIARLLAQASERAPLLFVLEDLHRADAASLDLLSRLLDEIALRRIMIVATVRRAHGEAEPEIRARLAHVLGHPNTERLALERLRAADVRAYVTSVLGECADGCAQAVFEKSEGNPFFMAELCRQLRERGPDGRDVLALPQAALELVRQHVRKLDADALGVLSAAAVIGRGFELPLLQGVTGREPAALMESLDAALAAEVVVPAADSATGFAFGHELLRTVLYDAIAPADRRALHVRVASALERRAEHGCTVAPSELAYHLHAGLPLSDPKKAVHYCRTAAAVAAKNFANDDVVRYVRHALEALDLTEQPSIRLRMHLLYLSAMYARGDAAADYETSTRQLTQLARKSGDAPMLVRAAIMFNLHPGFQQLSGAADELSHALTILPTDDLAMRAVALSGLAMSTPTCFSRQATGRLLDEAVPLARASSSRAALYVALIAALQLRGGSERAEEASAVLEELSALAQQNPTRMPVLPVDLAIYRAVTRMQAGDLANAERAIRAAAAHCRALHHSELLWHADRMAALIALNQGKSQEALRSLQGLHERARRQRLYGVAPFVAFDLAATLGECGGRQLDDEERRALAYAPCDPPSLWSMKVRALAAIGAKDEARTALRALSPHDLASLPCDRDLLGTLGHVVNAALTIHALDYAEHAAARLAAYRDSFAVHIGFVCEGSVPQLLGSVALALGDVDRAVRELETGLARELRAGFSLCAGYARLQLGRALVARQRAGDKERARQLFAEARSDAVRVGMERLAQAANRMRDQRL